MAKKIVKGWYAIAHTRVGNGWSFVWAAWAARAARAARPTARFWKSAVKVGSVPQLDDRGDVALDVESRIEAAVKLALDPEGVAGAQVRLTQLEDGFALAAHREVIGEEPRYRPVDAPGMVAEAFYSVVEVDRTMALPTQAVTVLEVDDKGAQLAVRSTEDPLALRETPTGRSVFWACWVSCGKPTLEPWTPPDDLGIVTGPGAFHLAIGLADEACRRLRGDFCYAYSVGHLFASRSYTDGARCTTSKLVDIVSDGLAALAWLGLDKTAAESHVTRAWGKKIADEKLHPDQYASDKELFQKMTGLFQEAEAKKRAALVYLEYLASTTGKITAFSQERIDAETERNKNLGELRKKKREKAAAKGQRSFV